MNSVLYQVKTLLMANSVKIFGAMVVCLLAVLLLGKPLMASEIKGLYETEVFVSDQSEDARVGAIRRALTDVLVRVSGNRKAAHTQSVIDALKRPSPYVKQFRYRSLEMTSAVMAGDMRQDEIPPQLLHVSFDETAINRLLFSAGMSVWGRARPSTLLWLAIEDDNGRYLLGGDGARTLAATVRDQSDKRGLPVLTPLFDLQDQSSIGFSDVWGDFQDTILSASLRYHTEAILVGRIYQQEPDLWHARWSLYLDGQVQRWVVSAEDEQMVMIEGIDWLGDVLAAKFAQAYSDISTDTVDIKVNDIKSVDSYVSVMRYLEALDSVLGLVVLKVEKNDVTYRLSLRSGVEGLKRAIAFGNTLTQQAPLWRDDIVDDLLNQQAENDKDLIQMLHYRLLF